MSGSFIVAFAAIVIIVILVLVHYAVKSQKSARGTEQKVEEPINEDGIETVRVSIQTTKGEIVLELRPDLMPLTVSNFMRLVNSGFYNGLTFHRVELWLIQGGDPTGTGVGGPGWTIRLEINRKLKHVKYAVGMARLKDPHTAGSQFYILKKDVRSLNDKYAVFGSVVKGKDVVNKIEVGDKMLVVKEII